MPRDDGVSLNVTVELPFCVESDPPVGKRASVVGRLLDVRVPIPGIRTDYPSPGLRLYVIDRSSLHVSVCQYFRRCKHARCNALIYLGEAQCWEERKKNEQ